MRRRRKVILTILLALFMLIFVFSTDYSPDLYFMTLEPYEDVSCHYVRDGDALPAVDERFLPSSNSVFFHETSCRGRLNSRQACAVESAARMHPHWEVHVFFSGPITKLGLGDVNLYLLKMLKNVNFHRVNLLDYAKGTPLENLVHEGALNRTKWPVSHTSDVLRYLSLYKWGGIYLDLDTVVLKPLDGLSKNWAARENDAIIGSAAMAFYRDSVGTFVADASVKTLANTYRGDVWGQNGPILLTKVLKEICSTDDVTDMSADNCLGFQVYPPEMIYGMNPDNPQQFFEPGELELNPATYIYHIWNHQTEGLRVLSGTPYAKLAKRFCPIIYENYRSHFGI